MNPQMLNMAGMGRGAPAMGMNVNMNNMNNMNMGMAMGMNNPGMMPNNMNIAQPNPAGQFQKIIYQSLQSESQQHGPYTGWKKEISLQERGAQIKVLFDSLRMLGAQVDGSKSLNIALMFERKQFNDSQTREDYHRSIHEKLASIRDQRQRQLDSQTNQNLNQQQQQPQQTPQAQNMNLQQQQQQQQRFQQQNMQNGVNQSPMVNQMNALSNMTVSTGQAISWLCTTSSLHDTSHEANV